MNIKFANGKTIEAKTIEYFKDTNNIEFVEFEEPIDLKLRYGITSVSALRLYNNGTVERASITKPKTMPTPFGNFEFTKYLYFYNTSKFKGGVLFKSITINAPVGELNVNNYIAFYENNKLKLCKPDSNKTIKTPDGKLYLKEITFNNNGRIIYGKLAKDTTINNRKIRKRAILHWKY